MVPADSEEDLASADREGLAGGQPEDSASAGREGLAGGHGLASAAGSHRSSVGGPSVSRGSSRDGRVLNHGKDGTGTSLYSPLDPMINSQKEQRTKELIT